MRAFLVAAAIASVHTPSLTGDRTAFPVIDAYGGRVVWSDWDATARRWRLMEYSGGAARAVPVPPRRSPFDVDLGPDGHGGALAVYSRCRRDFGIADPTPQNRRAARYGCDLFSYSFRTGREAPVRRANSRADETWPAVWGSRIAFVRTSAKRKDRYGRAIPYVYWRARAGGGSSHRLRRPSPVITIRMSGPEGWTIERRRLAVAISELDMRGRRVAYKWDRIDDDDTTHFVYVATTGGGLRAVARGATLGGGASDHPRDVSSPTLGAGGAVDWLFTNETSPEYFGAFLRTAGGGVQSSPRTKAAAFAHDDATAYWIDAGPAADSDAEFQLGGTFQLLADSAVSYGPMPRSWLPIPPP
jgi:hypothetical protein